MMKKDYIVNSVKFENYSVIDHELLNKIIYDVGKVTKSPSHLAWFASAYLGRSNKLRTYLFFILWFFLI